LPNAISGCPAGFTCVPASTTPSLSEASTFAADLSPGDTGQGVLALQEYLNEHGFPVASSGAGSSGHETTTFGPATKAALKAFQKAHNITPTGNLGPLTRALINKDSKIPAAPAFPRDLSVDSSGPDVKVLQMFLNNLGYIIAANGAGSPGQETTFFGTKTAAALSLFQDDHSLSSDTGVLSGTTRSLINQLYSQKQ
jgi:peptidoglycan hydrolase-like protein with peptidoglycan-binding domain